MATKFPDLQISRLCLAMHRARLVLRKPREVRVQLTRQYVGQHWSEEGSSHVVPVNLLALYTSIVGRKLIANNPRFMLSVNDRRYKPTVSIMEQWANQQVVKMNLANTIQRVVVDSLFSIGICKVALAGPADSAIGAWNVQAGRPFAQRVDLDDFVFDVHARDFSECSFIGHRFRAPLEAVRKSKVYAKARETLTHDDDQIFNLEGDERIGIIGQTTLAGQEEYEDMVDLWEVYLPRHRLVVTLTEDQLTGPSALDTTSKRFGKALRVQHWIGPDCGPYHMLALQTVPGNAMPKGPLQDLVDLHMSINQMCRKLMRQADRQKQILLVQGGATEDGKRIIEANDGEGTRVDDPKNSAVVSYGGPDQNNFQLFGAFKDLFSWMSGNLDIMGGLSPQARTAAQDEMLNANSSATIGDMQQRVVELSASVVRALCWYWHHDPQKVMRTRYSAPGLPGHLAIDRFSHPAGQEIGTDGKRRLTRNFDFDEMDIHVDPYSLQHQTPQQRLAALTQIVTQIVLPALPVLQQQGIGLDMQAFLKKVAKYADQPDLAEIIRMVEVSQTGPAPEGGAPTPMPGKPAETTRNYVRRSESGASAAGKDLGAVNAMRTGAAMNGNGQHP